MLCSLARRMSWAQTGTSRLSYSVELLGLDRFELASAGLTFERDIGLASTSVEDLQRDFPRLLAKACYA